MKKYKPFASWSLQGKSSAPKSHFNSLILFSLTLGALVIPIYNFKVRLCVHIGGNAAVNVALILIFIVSFNLIDIIFQLNF